MPLSQFSSTEAFAKVELNTQYHLRPTFASMKIAIVNGPNLNLVGERETEIYGTENFETLLKSLRQEFPKDEFVYYQSNVEGELINELHRLRADQNVKGIIINAGGYTHTSIALGDAVAAMDKPVIEVHLSHIFSREDFRHVSYIGRAARGTIAGFGMEGYRMAVGWLSVQS